MKTSTKLWIGFRMCRVVVFALATIMSMALSVIYAVLLIREWKFYNDAQRAVLIIILVIDGFSTILLYLMIIVRFRLWLDGARVAFLVLFQGGGTVTFAIFNSSLPCNNLGSVQTCKTVMTVAIFGGWSLTGLLILYAFCLAIMSHIPQPPPPRNPEESLNDTAKNLGHSSSPSVASTASSRTWTTDSKSNKWSDEKRRSLISESGSEYSEISWIGSRISPDSRATTPRSRTPSNASRGTTPAERYGVYRPTTPNSIRSPAASSISSSLYPAKSVASYNSGHHNFAPHPMGYYSTPATPFQTSNPRLPFLPNPFLEPVSRSGTPASIASFHSDGFLYTPHAHVRNLIGPSIPPSLQAGGRIPAHPPPYQDHHEGFVPRNVLEGPVSVPSRSEVVLDRLNNSPTPLNLQYGAPARRLQEALKSPGAATVLSHSASIRVLPNRRASLLSVPRSPSPYNFPLQMGLPASPRALLLPTHPQLHPMDLHAAQRFHEVRRFGSSPDLRLGTPVAGVHRNLSAGSTTSSAGSVSVHSLPAQGIRPLLLDPYQTRQVRFTPG